MNSSQLKFENEGLTITLRTTAKEAEVLWQGVSDSRTPAVFLGPVLDKIVRNTKGLRVTVDFRQMEFMNSSTISPIVNLAKTLNGSCPEVLFLFSNIDWQQVHLRCMRTITRVLANVTVDGRPAPPRA